MARMIMRRVFGPVGTLIAFIILVGYIAAAAWPSSWWMTVNSVVVFDSQVGQPIMMRVDRSVNSPFVGHWAVVVRSVSADKVMVHCTAEGNTDYRTDAVLPEPLTLEWWASPKCAQLPVGRYIISTIWDIDFLPWHQKQIVAESNPFYVLPKMEDEIMSPARSIGKQSQWRTDATLSDLKVMKAKLAVISTIKPIVEAAAN